MSSFSTNSFCTTSEDESSIEIDDDDSSSEESNMENAEEKVKENQSYTLYSANLPTDVYMKRVLETNFAAGAQKNPNGLPVKFNELTYTRKTLPVDPWCDPKNPKDVHFQEISAAAYRIRNGIVESECKKSNMLSSMLSCEIYFKKDFLQVTGSFKERGARNTLMQLNETQKKNGVIAASAGNHALGLSFHGQLLNIPVTVVMPVTAPLIKISNCRQYGANVIIQGNDLGESKELAMKMAEEKGYVYVNGYDHPHIIAGVGTMGVEIVSQVENVDAIIVPIGGGGLIAGVSVFVKYLNPHTKIYGVEPERCPSFVKSLEANKPTYVKVGSTLADGLAVPLPGVNSFAIASRLVDKVVTVNEEFISLAILRLVEVEKAVVEGAGAIGLAAMLAGSFPELQGKRVVIPLTGGNIDSTVLGRCIERGLAVDRRLVRFSVTISDRPGGMAELASLISQIGASIKYVYFERACVKTDIFSVRVKIVAETRGNDHANELERALKAHYNDVVFNRSIC